jgi:hypothetical protein
MRMRSLAPATFWREALANDEVTPPNDNAAAPAKACFRKSLLETISLLF